MKLGRKWEIGKMEKPELDMYKEMEKKWWKKSCLWSKLRKKRKKIKEVLT